MTLATVRRIKQAVLPREKRCRRLPFGIARGVKLEIDFAIQTKMFLGLYEVELNKYIRRLCRPGSVCFDVGGQFGYDALALAKLSNGSVVSFECDEEACEEMERNVRQNPKYGSHITIVRSFVASSSDQLKGQMSLDDYVGSSGLSPDFIKMDIEGGEYDGLIGARRILEDHHPRLLVETHSAELEAKCLHLVDSFGYKTLLVNPRGWFPDYRPTAHNRWFVAE